ncbi:MAG: DciA family protein [Pseudomonadota bacterium]
MKQPQAIGNLVSRGMNDLLHARTGMTGDLISQWRTIAGDELADHCAPIKLKWARRASHAVGDAAEKPATLIVSASGVWALKVQHSTGEIIARVNAYFGYAAISRIAIEQRGPAKNKQIPIAKQRTSPRPSARVTDQVSDIRDPELRETLARLGAAIEQCRKR